MRINEPDAISGAANIEEADIMWSCVGEKFQSEKKTPEVPFKKNVLG